jgi:hypothetical protein
MMKKMISPIIIVLLDLSVFIVHIFMFALKHVSFDQIFLVILLIFVNDFSS